MNKDNKQAKNIYNQFKHELSELENEQLAVICRYKKALDKAGSAKINNGI